MLLKDLFSDLVYRKDLADGLSSKVEGFVLNT